VSFCVTYDESAHKVEEVIGNTLPPVPQIPAENPRSLQGSRKPDCLQDKVNLSMVIIRVCGMIFH
jgi:hypothetical protein